MASSASTLSSLGEYWGVFLRDASEQNLGCVLVGGMLGGLLQPIYEKLDTARPDPTRAQYFLSALLGLAAAGISVYIVANSDTDDPVRLMFFSLLCGLAFPAVLKGAVDSVSRRTADVQRISAAIAHQSKSNEISATTDSADKLKTMFASNPAETIKVEGLPAVEATAQITVQNIAETASANPETAPAVVSQLEQLGAVARTAGYDVAADSVTSALNKISGSAIDEDTKDAARAAARRLHRN